VRADVLKFFLRQLKPADGTPIRKETLESIVHSTDLCNHKIDQLLAFKKPRLDFVAATGGNFHGSSTSRAFMAFLEDFRVVVVGSQMIFVTMH
jgi:hypothetical protein